MNGDFAVAVHALVFLYHRQETLASDVLAWNICTNPVRVRKVMAKLRKAGLAEAREGKFDGGYRALPDGGDIRLCAVLKALDERCIAPNWKPGGEEADCLISSGMATALDEIYDRLNECCVERLADITVADVSRRIFAGGPGGLKRPG
ncbi:MAG TPA: Rrf2 family transcriptional regulator [Clostridia bacterium]|nr:Rrf2 family transcriptional regulator [Clostridia bacterium]